jgi:type I restriction enzyme R subunit
MPSPYSEDQLVEQTALHLLAGLGWQLLSANDYGVSLLRDAPSDAILRLLLIRCLKRLNPGLPEETIRFAADEIAKDRSVLSPAEGNREVYSFLKDGLRVSLPDKERGIQKIARVQIVDWSDTSRNEFLAINQLPITGLLYNRRPDIICFVNGLPLLVIELKKPGVNVRQALTENLRSYKSDIPQLFWSNAALIVSNGLDSRVGTITAGWEHFAEWKRVENEAEERAVSLEKMIRGVCEHSRLLDLAENFTLFSEKAGDLKKIIAMNHQFLGVNNAIASLEKIRGQHGRLGVFWHTQGSGKSFSMVFFAQKVLRKISGNWTFVIITDRAELDDQIYRTFAACGATSEHCQAESVADLRRLLTENHRYVFTLIQKFQTETGRPHPVLSERADIIVITDEAHRSQYDTLAMNMRTALPNASFIAFTGTPLMAGEERTKQVFGDYVSIYNFQQAVEDGATVPLYYENRTPELQIQNPNLNEDLYALIEAAELNEDQERNLARAVGRQYQILTRDERLNVVAKDIVDHFLNRGFQGKAMVVSIDKATALRMYNKVRENWSMELVRVKQSLELALIRSQQQRTHEIVELDARRLTLETTDMALVVSQSQNEIEQMQQIGLDIKTHRERMNKEPLDEKFKDDSDPLRLVFVCAMWLTGFDAPSCSTIYLDKPMRNHTLMQTIARANRVFPEKQSGLIVDYCNVFASLERALAIWGGGAGGTMPVQDKSELVEQLARELKAAEDFCSSHHVSLADIESVDFHKRLLLLENAVNQLISPENIRKQLFERVDLLTRLYRAIKPDNTIYQFASKIACLRQIVEAVKDKLRPESVGDLTAVLKEMNRILDDSIGPDAPVINELDAHILDLSKINFQELAERFEKSRKQNIELERLREAVQRQLDKVIKLNETRTDFLDKFQRLIDEYNAGSRNIEEVYRRLIELTKALSEEEERHIRENLTEEELAVFDILTRPEPELLADEREEVKKVARQLLSRINSLLGLDWRKKNQARARVQMAIEDTLYALHHQLPGAYTDELYRKKCASVFQHLFEKYSGEGDSVYASVA